MEEEEELLSGRIKHIIHGKEIEDRYKGKKKAKGDEAKDEPRRDGKEVNNMKKRGGKGTQRQIQWVCSRKVKLNKGNENVHGDVKITRRTGEGSA